MTSVRILITDREMMAITTAWALYEAEYEGEDGEEIDGQPEDYQRNVASLARLKAKWYKAKDAADARRMT